MLKVQLGRSVSASSQRMIVKAELDATEPPCLPRLGATAALEVTLLQLGGELGGVSCKVDTIVVTRCMLDPHTTLSVAYLASKTALSNLVDGNHGMYTSISRMGR